MGSSREPQAEESGVTAGSLQGNVMKKFLCTVVGVIVGLTLLAQSADAKSRRGGGNHPRVVIGPFDFGDERVFWSGVLVGGAFTGAYFAIENKRVLKVPGDGGNFNTGAFLLTSVGCATIAPMVASAWVWNTEGRYLTSREALGLGAGCFLPVLGGLLVDAAYQAHPEWK